MMLPILERLEEETANLVVVKVNADENSELVAANEVTSIPTMILYKNGEEIWKITGGKPLGFLVEKIAPFI
jgi:thioredoxin 1